MADPEVSPAAGVPTPARFALRHRIVRMSGRDPDESHRAATPLELLFDLTFVASFGVAADQASHYFAEGHIAVALFGFLLAMLAVCWAWVNFSWFASAYDTDDWFFRVMTMVQMVGVIVIALGLPAMFLSLDEGAPIGNDVLVGGYVVMRVALVALWLRAARQDPVRRDAALTYALVIGIAQALWVLLLALREAPTWLFWTVLLLSVGIEILGPFVGERKGTGSPWNAWHIAERYGLLVIIALGEGIFGTIASVSAIVEHAQWSPAAITLVIAGVGLTFSLWWIYFAIPTADVLHHRRRRAYGWGLLHIPAFLSVVATGAGLHVAAYVFEGEARVSATTAVLAVAIPVLVFIATLFTLFGFLVGFIDVFHFWLLAAAVAIAVLAVGLSAAGVSMEVCLLVVMLSPLVIVAGYETIGYRHENAIIARALAG